LKNNTLISFLGTIVILFATLACRAATRLIPPDTSTPLTTITPVPSVSATSVSEYACPILLVHILQKDRLEEHSQVNRWDRSYNKEEKIELIGYKITGDKISPSFTRTVPETLEDEQNDHTTHTAIWDYFVSIIPKQQRNFVYGFSIFTDGRGRYSGAVSKSIVDPKELILEIDIFDASNYYDLTYTLIHEHGHLLTLNAKQVPPSYDVFYDPNNKTIYEQEVSSCPQYFAGEGCSTPDSYINQFYDRFWPELYPEWKQIDLEGDEDAQYGLFEAFYNKYKDQFLTNYAPTNPLEDIAESWTFFILSPKPERDSIANEKILFFYEYPELVKLRTQIQKRICVEFPR
jgi:hypothetical protein